MRTYPRKVILRAAPAVITEEPRSIPAAWRRRGTMGLILKQIMRKLKSMTPYIWNHLVVIKVTVPYMVWRT